MVWFESKMPRVSLITGLLITGLEWTAWETSNQSLKLRYATQKITSGYVQCDLVQVLAYYSRAKELVTEDMATWMAKILAIDSDSGNKCSEMSLVC